ncbi:MAG: CPBP family intramembrane metalloprotease [Gemmatimonadetes bacterium]|nr:CPBP family intramembrane metalloprotease [Gemmatimonadota bacterium]
MNTSQTPGSVNHSMSAEPPAPTASIGFREGWVAAIYFCVYLAYLFVSYESELLHWLTLVALPLALVFLLRRGEARRRSEVLASFGLRKGRLLRGMGWALLMGGALGLFQLGFSRYGDAIRELVMSGKALFLLPLTFVLMMLTAGFTEEFFFRGFLQTRLEVLTRSRVAAVILASICFGLYHLPYAYFNPAWPSAGDWGAAWISAMGQGVPGGLLLGTLYLVSRRNVLACAVLHSLINALPAMTMIRFSGG